jgi:hypothetical protein
MPTVEQLKAQYNQCVNVTRFMIPINLIRLDERTGNIYILVGDEIQIEILPNGKVRYI